MRHCHRQDVSITAACEPHLEQRLLAAQQAAEQQSQGRQQGEVLKVKQQALAMQMATVAAVLSLPSPAVISSRTNKTPPHLLPVSMPSK
jgi:hypothetical protein